MGLGKTVVCLALILQNAPSSQRAPRQGGTLIAATPALMGQWESEVRQGLITTSSTCAVTSDAAQSSRHKCAQAQALRVYSLPTKSPCS